MMTCDEVRCILKNMMHNISEAREKIHKANEWKDKHRGIADWFRQMAVGHLEYNTGAMQMVKNGLHEIRNEHAHSTDPEQMQYMHGKCEAYEEWLNQIGPETAEVRAMIDGYGK